MVLQWHKSGRPFGGKEIIHATEMLAKFDEDGAIPLHCLECPISTSLVASAEDGGPIIFIVC